MFYKVVHIHHVFCCMIYLPLIRETKDGKLSSIGLGILPFIYQTQTKASIYELYIRKVGSNTDRLQLM